MQELWDDALTPNATLQQLIAAWFSRRYTRFKKRSADFHGRASELVHGLRGMAVPKRQPLKGQARVAALRELRSLASTHQSVTKAIAEAGGVALLTSLFGPFTSHAVGSEAVAILVSGVPLDADAKAALMQPAEGDVLALVRCRSWWGCCRSWRQSVWNQPWTSQVSELLKLCTLNCSSFAP